MICVIKMGNSNNFNKIIWIKYNNLKFFIYGFIWYSFYLNIVNSS